MLLRSLLRLWARSQPAARYSSASGQDLSICVVGSGPAGFYAATQVLKQLGQRARVNILDRLPTPFGLVRSGVAPDHPDTKNVIHQYTNTAKDDRVSFFGNVTVGKDIALARLRSMHDAVILACGAESSTRFSVPGEDLAGVLSAREFVWWYNGHPEHCNLPIDLTKTHRVAICGMGNVALDCARILLQPPDRLAPTDIATHALSHLRKSMVQRVDIIGRRGPVQVSFAAKELREVLTMPGISVHMDPAQMQPTAADQAEMRTSRQRKRVFDIMRSALDVAPQTSGRELHLHFLRTTRRMLGNAQSIVTGLELERNELQQQPDGSQRPVSTGATEALQANMVLGSIGYRALPLPGAPFDQARGIIPNWRGRVLKEDASDVEPGLYVCGWVKRGPTGIIGTNLMDAQETVAALVEDVPGFLPPPCKRSLQEELQICGIQAVSFEDWLKLDAAEVSRGQALGKVREKAVSIPDMLASLRLPITQANPVL